MALRHSSVRNIKISTVVNNVTDQALTICIFLKSLSFYIIYPNNIHTANYPETSMDAPAVVARRFVTQHQKPL